MTHQSNSVIHDLAVCKKLCTYCKFWSIAYKYWTLLDAQVKKDEYFFRNSIALLEPKGRFFYFLNIPLFSPGGFFTFLVAVAHGVASAKK